MDPTEKPTLFPLPQRWTEARAREWWSLHLPARAPARPGGEDRRVWIALLMQAADP